MRELVLSVFRVDQVETGLRGEKPGEREFLSVQGGERVLLIPIAGRMGLFLAWI
jgi:hypothetical protein